MSGVSCGGVTTSYPWRFGHPASSLGDYGGSRFFQNEAERISMDLREKRILITEGVPGIPRNWGAAIPGLPDAIRPSEPRVRLAPRE